MWVSDVYRPTSVDLRTIIDNQPTLSIIPFTYNLNRNNFTFLYQYKIKYVYIFDKIISNNI